MYKQLLLISFIVSFHSLSAQNILYELMQKGPHKAGVFDTLLVDENKPYKQFGYEGGTPFFVKIWHPIKTNSGEFLKYDDFRFTPKNESLVEVHKELVKHMDSAFTWYNVQTDFVKYEDINYKKFTAYQVQDHIKRNTETISTYSPFRSVGDFPVIFYHHGAQGLSDENYLMAEYFASHGYIFVSANYHWAYDSLTYGSSPDYTYNTDAAKFIAGFVQDIAVEKETYFIGHSWGAQTGFSILHEDLGFDAFVSMETTLEYFDSTKIKKTWKRLYSIMEEHKADYTIPMLLFANRGKKSQFKFWFYEQIHNAHMLHASYKGDFGHESYTGIYLMRYLYRKQFKQPDNKHVKKQVLGYFAHLEFIRSFLESNKTEAYQTEEFEEAFYIKELNK